MKAGVLETPKPCTRAINSGNARRLKRDAEGILRCNGYQDIMDNPAKECQACPFFVHWLSEFWKSEEPMEQAWYMETEDEINVAELPWGWQEKKIYLANTRFSDRKQVVIADEDR